MAEKKSAASKSDSSVKPKKKISLIKKSDLAKSKAEKVAKKKAVKPTKAVEDEKTTAKKPAVSKAKVVAKKEIKEPVKAPIKAPVKAVAAKVAAPAKAVKSVKTSAANPPRKPVQDISKIVEKQTSGEGSVKKVATTKPVAGKTAIPVRVLDLSIPAGSKSSGKAPKEEEELTGPPKENPHSDAFIKKQKERLEDLYDEILRAINGTAREVIRNAPEGSEASGSGQHQGDAGSDAYDREFALSMLAKEQDSLYEIEQALYRIKKGIYGICEISFKKIPQPRLEALPFTRLTIECQQQWEKENGNRRFRPSNEVGFSGGNYAEDDDSDTVSLDDDDE